MKRILTLVLVAFTLVSTAQESVLLRINYKKGEQFLIKMEMDQDMPAMAMNMTMDMAVDIKSAKEGVFETETKFTRIGMDMLQGGMNMSYDSNMKDEELDEMGMALKGQMGPMLQIVITSKTDVFGKVSDVVITPNLPSASQFADQSGNVVYPEKAVKVGDTWSIEKDENGMKMNYIYTVKSITKEKVGVDLSGKISGMAIGTISGDMSIDRSVGIPMLFNMKMDMTVNGQKVSTTMKMTTTKM